jgi:hypothetical protein
MFKLLNFDTNIDKLISVWIYVDKKTKILLKKYLYECYNNFLNNINLFYNDNLEWTALPYKPIALKIILENQNNIDFYFFLKNDKLFTYDYKKIKETMKNSEIVEELMAYIFHPRNMEKWKDWGFTEHQEMLKLINE